MDLSPQSYIPGFKAIGQLVLEKKIYKLFLLYKGMEAILVKWLRPFEQTFLAPIL